MNTLELFVATCTTPTTETAGIAHWPHLDVTGTMIQIPRPECKVAGMDTSAIPEAAVLVRRIQDGLGLTIGQVAKALGCSRQAVHGWMRGKRIDPVNFSNLEAFADMAEERVRSGKERPSSLSWTDEILRGFADKGLSTEEGRELWSRFVDDQEASARRRSRIPTGAALDALLGARPSYSLEKAHRLADNLRSLKRHGR